MYMLKNVKRNKSKLTEYHKKLRSLKFLAPACGCGGMLTETQNCVEEKYPASNRDIYLYGKEINDETYAICKSDMMITGGDPENIKQGSSLSEDRFQGKRFDYMLTNPPFGVSWNSEKVLSFPDFGQEIVQENSGTDPVYGVGMRFFINYSFEIGAEYQYADFETKTESYSVVLGYRF